MTTISRVRSPYVGIYDVPRAAGYLRAGMPRHEHLRVSSPKLIRWIRAGLASPELSKLPGRDLLITFEDLVSMRVIAALRAAGVTFPKIYDSERWLREHTGHPRPFATEQLWTERTEVFAEFASALIATSRFGQLAMELLRSQLIPIHGLHFDEGHVANRWRPAPFIELDPQIQAGASCIAGTRVPTYAIWDMERGGDSVGHIARSYRVQVDEVEAAIRWEADLATK